MFTITFFTLTLLAEPSKSKEPKNAVSIDVLLPIMSPISHLQGEEAHWLPLQLKYQRVLTDHFVLMLRYGMFYYWSDKPIEIDFFPMAELDWHPFQKGLRGFYAGVSAFYCYSNTFDSPERLYRINMGPTLGWQFVLPWNITIDLTLGVGFGYHNQIRWDGTKKEDFGVDETIGGIFVGWAF